MSEKHVRWQNCIESAKTGVLKDAEGKRPDIIVNHPGSLPVIIESEFEPARTVEKDALSRLGNKLKADGCLIEQVIALKIPSSIVTVNQQHLEEALSKAEFRYALLMVNGLEQIRWPEKGYIEGPIDDFVSFVEQTELSESTMTKGLEGLESSISVAANIIRRDSHLGISTQQKLAELLNQVEGEQTTRMAMAILANAVSFHNTIANLHKVKHLSNLRSSQGNYVQSKISDEWKRIYTEINYWPILYIAREILNSLPPIIASRVFSVLVESAQQLEGIGATSQHDLSGRMLQRLIADRKFLATFYTLPSSATLLAELAISRLNVDWSKPEEITKLQIGDFACGTGALLNAAYRSVLARYRRTGGDDSKLHAPLIEKTLVGTDIMPAATHLTASILSSAHPAEPFQNTRIITLPYGVNENAGGDTIDLGSLDLIKDEEVFSLFKTGQERLCGGANGDKRHVSLPHKSFEVVIMNPPFTRATTHEGDLVGVPNPAFAGFSTTVDEQQLMSRKLGSRPIENPAGHGNAGLASNFIDIANAKIKEGGILALVLPLTFAIGSAWEGARKLLERFYKDIFVVSIANDNSGGSAFSSDTGIAEVLVIATRLRTENASTSSCIVTYINLTHRPSSIAEAVETARAIDNADRRGDRGVIKVGSDLQVGHFIRSKIGFKGYVGIRDGNVAETAEDLYNNKLTLPRMKQSVDIPLVYLGELGVRGAYVLDVNGNERDARGTQRGAFDVEKIMSNSTVTYPMLWGHVAKKETRFLVQPDRHGVARSGYEDRALDMWQEFAGRLCFNRAFRLNAQPLMSCFTTEQAIASSSWHGFNCHDQSHEVPILLFSNTTIGLISHWWRASRQQFGRPILTITRLPDLVTIDPRDFSAEQFIKAEELFHKFKIQEFLPANEAFRDEVRKKLDEAVLVVLLGLDRDILEPLDFLRYKWCSEPSVHGGKSTRPT